MSVQAKKWSRLLVLSLFVSLGTVYGSDSDSDGEVHEGAMGTGLPPQGEGQAFASAGSQDRINIELDDLRDRVADADLHMPVPENEGQPVDPVAPVGHNASHFSGAKSGYSDAYGGAYNWAAERIGEGNGAAALAYAAGVAGGFVGAGYDVGYTAYLAGGALGQLAYDGYTRARPVVGAYATAGVNKVAPYARRAGNWADTNARWAGTQMQDGASYVNTTVRAGASNTWEGAQAIPGYAWGKVREAGSWAKWFGQKGLGFADGGMRKVFGDTDGRSGLRGSVKSRRAARRHKDFKNIP